MILFLYNEILIINMLVKWNLLKAGDQLTKIFGGADNLSSYKFFIAHCGPKPTVLIQLHELSCFHKKASLRKVFAERETIRIVSFSYFKRVALKQDNMSTATAYKFCHGLMP